LFITLANVANLIAIYQLIHKKILYVYLTKTSTSPAVTNVAVATLPSLCNF